MSLYYDAASILSNPNQGGSLKSHVFALKVEKSRHAQLLALISETAKYDSFLKEVIDHTGFLTHEPKLTPLLSLLLVHDHFFASRGIAASAQHPLRQAVERHKARLQAEFTKARLRRKCATVETLKETLKVERGQAGYSRPRWIRINSLRTPNDFADAKLPSSISNDNLKSLLSRKEISSYHRDPHIPNLYAFHPDYDFTSTDWYRKGEIILQDKASCIPAYLLLGDQSVSEVGDVIDACAAPGNKTTQLASLMHGIGAHGKIFACERDSKRSETLESMVEKAEADAQVYLLPKQDFFALRPSDPRFVNVTHLLLDPSCSGSGIVGREDIPKLALPEDLKRSNSSAYSANGASQLKKRKRGGDTFDTSKEISNVNADISEEQAPVIVTRDRLVKLSNLQTHIVEHAMHFPAARRITYSTCSIHREENEQVVSRVLSSSIAQTRGWRTLKRDEQVDGMRRWKHRGAPSIDLGEEKAPELAADDLESCIRCYAGDKEGTMGFFVCGFVRDNSDNSNQSNGTSNAQESQKEADMSEDENWEGFSDA